MLAIEQECYEVLYTPNTEATYLSFNFLAAIITEKGLIILWPQRYNTGFKKRNDITHRRLYVNTVILDFDGKIAYDEEMLF